MRRSDMAGKVRYNCRLDCPSAGIMPPWTMRVDRLCSPLVEVAAPWISFVRKFADAYERPQADTVRGNLIRWPSRTFLLCLLSARGRATSKVMAGYYDVEPLGYLVYSPPETCWPLS